MRKLKGELKHWTSQFTEVLDLRYVVILLRPWRRTNVLACECARVAQWRRTRVACRLRWLDWPALRQINSSERRLALDPFVVCNWTLHEASHWRAACLRYESTLLFPMNLYVCTIKIKSPRNFVLYTLREVSCSYRCIDEYATRGPTGVGKRPQWSRGPNRRARGPSARGPTRQGKRPQSWGQEAPTITSFCVKPVLFTFRLNVRI